MGNKVSGCRYWSSVCKHISSDFFSLVQATNKNLWTQEFYDPVKDRLKEPSNTGVSYSFTEDGYYEEAYYRAVSNR